jgi:nucleoside-diphosphate-sugar epimerase
MGHDAVAHVRPDCADFAQWHVRFEALGARVDTTPWGERTMAETLQHLCPTHVFALLGTTRKRVREARRDGRDPRLESYEAVDHQLTAMLIRAAVSAGCVQRFVYLSAMGAKQDSRNPYMLARGLCERDLRDSGLPHTIARPGFITGPDREERRTGERVVATTSNAVLRLAAGLGARKLRDRYASMDAGTLATALVRAAVAEDMANRIVEADLLRTLGA